MPRLGAWPERLLRSDPARRSGRGGRWRSEDGCRVGSVDDYRDALAGVDWSDFEYELGESRLHDGHYKIDVTIAGGEANVPEPLRRWGLIQFSPLNGQPIETGIVIVRISPLNDPSDVGILAGA